MCNAIDINSLPSKAGLFGNLGLACDIVIAPWISDYSRVNGFRLCFFKSSTWNQIGFKVLLLNQFGFNPTNNVFYLKNVSSYNGTIANVATLLR